MTNASNNKKDAAEDGAVKGAHLFDRYSKQADKSGASSSSPYFKSQAPSIELPKGGGALKGIDEKFSVNAVNGTASLHVSLPLTTGRNGFTPNLSLQYNSGNGNSEYGLGWGLSLSSIQRRTDKKLPEYNDDGESDVFLLAGAEDLVPLLDDNENVIIINPVENAVATPYHIKRYVPRIEGLFARIEYITQDGTSDSWWRVITKENIVTYYGLTAAARLVDPADNARIFKWLPQLSFDNKGNVQQYTYADENLLNVPSNANEYNRKNGFALFTNKYLKSVKYCNKIPLAFDGLNGYTVADVYKPALPASPDYLMELIFDYGDHADIEHTDTNPYTYTIPYTPNNNWHYRSDAFSDFHAGFEIRTYRRCYRALMFHFFEEMTPGNAAHELKPVLVKVLDIEYQNGNDNAELGSFTEADMAISLTESGYKRIDENIYVRKYLPALTCNYQALSWSSDIEKVSGEDLKNMPQGLTGNYQWIDLNGEGMPGVLTEQGNAWYFKENLGNGHFGPARMVTGKPSLTGLGNTLQWKDLDADGRRHLVNMDNAMPGYYELDDDQKWQPFKAFKEWVNIDWNSPYTKVLDLNGDGRADVLITEERAWRWYENNGTDGYRNGGGIISAHEENKGPQLLYNDMLQSIFLADINGDGLTDIVRIQNGEVCYWPNAGYGVFGAKVVMDNAPVFDRPDLFNPLYLVLADISGTGAADIIYLKHDKCTAWINQAGNAFSEATVVSALPGVDPFSKITVMDFLGSGTSCIVWSSPLPQHTQAPLYYIDLMGSNKPYLLTSYGNGMGKTTTLTYKHSTQYYLEDKAKGNTWATRLPFPVHCVSKTTIADAVSQTAYSQSFTYHHGYYDHEEREFRGFGRVDILDAELAAIDDIHELDQAPVLTRTWYHTGAFLREKALILSYENEYINTSAWNIDAIAAFPPGMDTQECREAHRALKTLPLRQEVYAADAVTGDPETLYSITANSYIVKQLQPLAGNRYAVFLTHQQDNVVWHCEWDLSKNINDCDYRTLHSLVMDIDDYGNVLTSAEITYPRLIFDDNMPLWVDTMQQQMLISYTQHQYTNAITNDLHAYHLPLLYDTMAHELTGLDFPVGLWQPADLTAAFDGAFTIGFADAATHASAEKRMLAHTRALYRENDAATVLPLGTIDSLGLEHEHYQLAFTADILEHALDSYYTTDIADALTDAAKGGYKTEAAITAFGSTDADKLWLPGGTVQYAATPVTAFYSPVGYTDPWGNETTLTYWGSYYLVPASVTDAVSNETLVLDYDWRCLQPVSIQDINGNITEALYDALCLPVAIAMKGKGAEADYLDYTDAGNTLLLDADSSADMDTQAAFWGDPKANAASLLRRATWRCLYDFSTAPAKVAMIARTTHWEDDNNSPLIMRISYTDGLGRVLMHKVQTTDDPNTNTERWIGSGRTVHNNKGNAVMQYEPYFSATAACDTAEQAAAAGVSHRLYYDAAGRVVRIDMPDGSFSRTEYTAWAQTDFDNNDTAADSAWYITNTTNGGNSLDAAIKAAAHYNTPVLHFLDTLARPFYTRQYLVAPDYTNVAMIDYYDSYTDLDIQGNTLNVTDGANRLAMQYAYNMLKAPVMQHSADSGRKLMLHDAGGQALFSWDAAGRRMTHEYDALRRPVKQTLTDGTDSALEIMEYGEGATDDAHYNLRGKLHRHYDGAGMHLVTAYDFKGNALHTELQLLADATLADADWNASVTPTLSSEVFTTAAAYDALNRIVTTTDPGGNTTRHTYDAGGMLSAVYLTPAGGSESAYVSSMEYNARGQRNYIAYGNGTNTQYTYDADTYRLTRLLTRKNTDTYQDLNYWYDPVGNITRIKDDAQRALYFNNSVALPVMDYTYDPLYRLTQAKGREQAALATYGTADNYDDAPWMGISHKGDDNATQNYTQQYAYDAAGNLLQLAHSAATGSYTRSYTYDALSNRLTGTAVGSSAYSYGYDVHGNMDAMPHLGGVTYNALQQMSGAGLGGGGDVYYQYSGGQRLRKVILNGSLREERIYFGNFELYRKYISGTMGTERSTVHIADDTGRIAMLETPDSTGSGTLQRYVYSNHLDSAALELDGNANIISYEEYHPYGTTSFQSKNASINAVAKRYRFTGKERDEESGLYYHGARYYMPWLGRWAAADPLQGQMPLWSSYNYGYCNPVKWTDSTGMMPDPDKKDDNQNNAGKQSNPIAGISGPHSWRDSNGNKYSYDGKNPAELENVDVKGEKAQLGGLSEWYETLGKGPGTVSSGMIGKKGHQVEDPGGVSYGSYQFTSRTALKGGGYKIGGTVSKFLNSSYGSSWKSSFQGLKPGSKEFSAVWKMIATKHPDEFKLSQHEFIENTHYGVSKENLMKTGLDIDKRSATLRDVVWSVAVQHGPNNTVIKNALKGLDVDVNKLTDKQIIMSIYAERGSKSGNSLKYFTSLKTNETQRPILQRYQNEVKQALIMLATENKY